MVRCLNIEINTILQTIRSYYICRLGTEKDEFVQFIIYTGFNALGN